MPLAFCQDESVALHSRIFWSLLGVSRMRGRERHPARLDRIPGRVKERRSSGLAENNNSPVARLWENPIIVLDHPAGHGATCNSPPQ